MLAVISISARAQLRHHAAGLVLLQVAPPRVVSEEMVVEGATGERELLDLYGGRHHLFDAPAGEIQIHYDAQVDRTSPVPDLGELDRLNLLRPSRFCPSDLLWNPPVRSVDDVEDWVHSNLRYELGSSWSTEDALQTMQRGTGVCRDFAHVVVTICRAIDVPARVFSCYAPGLVPEDFHLVAEAWTGSIWRTIDATRLSDPKELIRICTGRDAGDTAWMTTYGPDASLELVDVRVS